MKKEIIGILICILIAITTIFPVSGNKNITNSDIEQQYLSDDVDWWPMYHHDLNLTGYTNSTAPLTNKILWAAEEFDGYWYDPQRSSPAIVDDTIYIGVCDPSYPKSDLNSKEINFKKNSLPLKNPFDLYRTNIKNPTIERWYETYVLCMNASTGLNKWKALLENEFYIRGSPAIAEDKVYITATESIFSPYGHLYCLDASTGSIIWYYPLNGYEAFSPAYSNGNVYASGWILGENYSKICKLFCLDANTGNEVFNTTLGFGEPFDAVSIYNNRIYLSIWDENTYNTFLYCLNTLDGTIYWIKTLYGNYWVSAPVIYNGTIFVISSSWDFNENLSCSVECFDAITGNSEWNNSIEGAANVWSTPAVAYDRFYFTVLYDSPDPYELDEKGWLYCLEATTGDTIWYKLLTEEGVFVSSPAIADGKIYINSMGYSNIHGYLYCIDAITGDSIWQYFLCSPIYSSPAIASGRLHLADWDHFYTFHDSASYDNPPIVTITGPQYGVPGIEYDYTILAEDPEEHDILVIFEWSREWPYGYYSWERPSGIPEIITLPFEEEGEYWLRARAQDTMNYTWSNWTTFLINISEDNRPSKPTITGPNNGKIGNIYDYSFVSTNSNEDDLWYFIDWGDDTNTGWIGPYPSSAYVNQSHSWSKKGTYNIKCKVKDAYNVESEWGELKVTMPRIKAINTPFNWLNKFLQNHPNLFLILRHLLGV